MSHRLVVFAVVAWAMSAAAGPAAYAASPPSSQPAFAMNPKLVDIADNTWVKMGPKFVYHPDQIAALAEKGRKPAGFCHVKGEASLCYDESANQTIYFGGCTSGYGNNLWVYNCSADVWTQIHPDIFKLRERDKVMWRYREDTKAVPPGCCYYGMCYDSNRKLNMLLRANSGATAWDREGPDNNLAWAYDSAAKQWAFIPRNGVIPGIYLTAARWAYDPVGRECLLVGGGELWAYKPAANTWRKVNSKGESAKPANASSWAYMDKEKKFLLFKALNKKSTAEDTTWFYDPASETWQNVTPQSGPPKRQSAAMCYDSTNNVAIMLGGWEEAPSRKFSDGTWVFDPTKKTWTQMNPRPCPQVQGKIYQMAYDRVNNVAIYVTGRSADNAETWVYRYRTLRGSIPVDQETS